MPRSLAQGHTRITLFLTKPTGNLAALPATAFADGTSVLDISCAVAMADFKLGASDEETFSEQAVCEEVAAEVPGSSKYDGNLTVFRYFDGTHKSDPTADKAWQALKAKGTTVWVARRDTSRLSKDPMTAADEYKLFEAITGEPGENPQEGYIKYPIKLYVQSKTDGVVAA